MPLYKRPKSPYWWVRIDPPHGGKRIRQSTGTTDRKEAEEYHDRLKVALWQPGDPGCGTWLMACVEWLKIKRKGRERSASDRYSLNAFNCAFLGPEDQPLETMDPASLPDRPLSECTPEALEAGLQRLAQRRGGFSDATYNRYLTRINAILHLADAKKLIGQVETLSKVGTPTKEPVFLTRPQWQRLLEELPDHLKAPARFAIATGLRQSNVLGMTWDRVDLGLRLAWVQAEDTKQHVTIPVPLSDDALQVLREQWGKDDGWVFPYAGRGRASEAGNKPIGKVKNAFQDACARAGIGTVTYTKSADGKRHREYQGFRWHDFRHTWASWHIMNGTPKEVLQKLGAWLDPRMVERYAHLHPGHLAVYAGNAQPYDPAAANRAALGLPPNSPSTAPAKGAEVEPLPAALPRQRPTLRLVRN